MGWNEIFTLTCRGRPTGIFDMKVQMGVGLHKKRNFLLYIFTCIWLLHMNVWQKKFFCRLNLNSACSNILWTSLTDFHCSGHQPKHYSPPPRLLLPIIYLLSSRNPGTPLTAQLDWHTRSKSELRELPVKMKSYERRWSWQTPVDVDSRLNLFYIIKSY